MFQKLTRVRRMIRAGNGVAFEFLCDLCGHPYRTQMVALRAPAWAARLRVPRQLFFEARIHFNRCRLCRRWVCDDDFRPDTSLCGQCEDAQS